MSSPEEYSGNTYCVAGPGSGKTRLLTAKAEDLIKAGKDPICLTFTRAAAQEIRDRVPGIPAGTIHSFCHSVVGWDGSHDDLLSRYIKEGKDKFQWVLVDEVQDLTPEQMQIVLSMVGENLFAVGDPFQSIYGYGGALGQGVSQILDSVNCKEFRLLKNYRSTPRIVDALNKIYPRNLESSGLNENGITSILVRSNDALYSVQELFKKEGIAHTARYGASGGTGKKEIFYGSGRLRLSTIHTAKGLEFSNVILHGWVPKSMKRYGNFKDIPNDGSDEETNVYYVAVSRAAQKYTESNSPIELLAVLEEFFPDFREREYNDANIELGDSGSGLVSLVHNLDPEDIRDDEGDKEKVPLQNDSPGTRFRED